MLNISAIPGRVYFPACSPATLLPTANTFYAHPFRCPPHANAFNSIGMRVTTAGVGAENAVRLAVYSDIDGRPGKLINDFGPLTALTAEGAAYVDFGPPLRFADAQPLLWLACVFNAADTLPTVAALGAAAPAQILGAALGVASLAALPSSGAEAFVTGVSAAMDYAEFPAMAPAVTVTVNAATPMIGLKVA